VIPVTTIVISDPDLLAKLTSAAGQIVFQTAEGHHIRTVEPIASSTPAKFNCPFTDDELDRLCKDRVGRSLKSILDDLKQMHGDHITIERQIL
jgi:hypothetical protein